MQRRRLISRTLVLVCTFGLSLLGVAGTAEAASKFAWTIPSEAPGGGTDVYLMNSDGTSETLLTAYLYPTYPHDINWSPDGTMLAVYLADETGGFVVENPRFQIIRISDGSVVANHPIANADLDMDRKFFAWSPEITPNVAAISPFGQFVIVFMLGGATALYLNRRRQSAGA